VKADTTAVEVKRRVVGVQVFMVFRDCDDDMERLVSTGERVCLQKIICTITQVALSVPNTSVLVNVVVQRLTCK